MAEPRLFRVILPVSNIEVATSFYAELLGMPGDRVSPGHHYFSCGDTILACHDALADGDPAWVGPNPQPFHFSVDDPEAIHERVRRIGGADVTPIESRPWGERSFYANDRWGFHLLRGLEDVLYPQQRLARPLTRGLRQASYRTTDAADSYPRSLSHSSSPSDHGTAVSRLNTRSSVSLPGQTPILLLSG